MTRRKIKAFRKIVLPFISKHLLDIDYEGQGKCDAEEFAKDFNEILDLATKALEQEPKTGDWIPVNERLPEKSVWVLAYCKTKDGYEYQAVLLIDKYRGEWTDNDDFCDEVIAWRPLPEPYKAESEAADL